MMNCSCSRTGSRGLSRSILSLAALALLACGVATAWAQPPDEPDNRPAFALSSSHVATTRERPSVMLTFRRVPHLDFRVYRVKDALKFFQQLRDPHTLGSETPLVPQEQTWLERIANWKSNRRFQIREFFRRQLSPRYRAARRARVDTQEVQLRRTVRHGSFAQVPVLNQSALVSSWRELLPPVRETEARRIPLELPGPGVYVVEAVHAPLRAYTVVIVSDIGLLTKASPGQIVVYAANRFSGEPVPQCQVQVVASRQVIGTGMTDADGLCDLRLDQPKLEDVVTVANCGSAVAATDPGSWSLTGPARELVGYIYTDRPIYRPGHTVNIRGVLRWRVRDELVVFDRKQVELTIADNNDKVVTRQTLTVDEFGAVHASFALPRGAALGYYAVRIAAGDEDASGSFEVQEYRKPEFEVLVSPADRFVVQGNRVTATITARYYFGQPVAGAEVQLRVHRQPYYSPFRWLEEGEDEESYGGGWWGGEEERQATARLDERGTAQISFVTPVDEEGRDYTWRLEARVTDSSSREVAGSATINATYGPFLLVSRLDRYVYHPGSPVTLLVRALDYTGRPQTGVPLTLWLERLTYAGGRWRPPAATRLADATATTDNEGRATWTTTLPQEPGTYRLWASALAGSRTIRDDAYAWVSGRVHTTFREDERFELIADKSSYQPGEVARLAIRGDAPGVPVLITKEGQDVSYARVARNLGGSSLEVPIVNRDVGDIYVNVAYIKDDRLFQAEKRLKVPAAARQLQITITPDQAVSRPRQTGSFTVSVVDAAGRPLQAQLSLGVVDEALYGVRPERTPDPLRFFYRREYSRVGTQFSRNYSFIGYSGTEQLLLARQRRPTSLADFKAERPLQPQVRKEFPDAIFWTSTLVTDTAGLAHIQVPYPDSLTTWRLTARAVTRETSLGVAVARTTTTKDLIVRVVTPRFLVEGDEAAIPVITHNYLPGSKDVAVSFQAAGVSVRRAPEEPAGPTGARTVSIAQGGEHRLDWQVTADHVGPARFTGTATAEAATDAVEVSVPVLPFGLKRQNSAAGSLVGSEEHSFELAIPGTSNPAARTVRVSLSFSLAGPLLGALDFLTSYPYGCTEQTLSSFVPNLSVLRALDQLKLPVTERLQSLDRQVTEGLQRLYDYQHDDGGWGWWKADQSSPFMTAYALQGLIEAKAAGYRVQEWRLDNAVRALARLYTTYPRAVPDLKAYLLYVFELAASSGVSLPTSGDAAFDRRAAFETVWSARTRMSPYGQAWLLLALEAAGDQRAAELAAWLADKVQKRGDLAWWPSDADPLLEDFGDTSVEATALIVKGLVRRDPQHPLLEPAVRWLLLNRNFGTYWSSTKQTAMVLYGLLDYMRARGERAGKVSVEVFVNGASVGTRAFAASSLTEADPMVLTAPGQAGTNTIRLVARGEGTIYWSAAAEYFETASPLQRTGSRKLALVRTYYRLTPVKQRNRIVYRETSFDGTARAGDLLLVRVSAAGSTDWRYLMIEDPLPAGVEVVQQRSLYELERRSAFWDGSRREHRDDRVVFFQESFSEGRYEFVYLLKVTTPGTFRALPAQIAPMYVADISASSDVQKLVVER